MRRHCAPDLPGWRSQRKIWSNKWHICILHVSSCVITIQSKTDHICSITDPYTSLVPSASNSILGRSIVVHAANGTRIACANLIILSATSGYLGGALRNMSNSSSPTGWMSWNPEATILPAIYSGGAIAQTGASFVRAAAPVVGIALGCWLL